MLVSSVVLAFKMLPRTLFVFLTLLLLPAAQPLILSRRAALEISLTFASTISDSSSSTSATSQQPGERVWREGDERVVVGMACQHTHTRLTRLLASLQHTTAMLRLTICSTTKSHPHCHSSAFLKAAPTSSQTRMAPY